MLFKIINLTDISTALHINGMEYIHETKILRLSVILSAIFVL